MNKQLTYLGAIGLGAGLMYLIDVVGGKRSLAVGCPNGLSLSTIERLPGKLSRDIRTQALAQRVRAEVDEVLARPHAIDVDVVDGRVTLRGGIRERETEVLLARVAAVPGVKSVNDQMLVLEPMVDGR